MVGDPHAFDSLFARHLSPLVAFIRARMGPELTARESATDLAQSVCREVLADRDDFEYQGEAAFRGWLYQQAARKIVDRSRHHHRARRDIAREVGAGGSEDDAGALLECYASICTPSMHAAAREELERFEVAVGELPESQRDALTMSRLMGMEYAEIAEVIGCSVSAVRGLVSRALATVVARLD